MVVVMGDPRRVILPIPFRLGSICVVYRQKKKKIMAVETAGTETP